MFKNYILFHYGEAAAVVEVNRRQTSLTSEVVASSSVGDVVGSNGATGKSKNFCRQEGQGVSPPIIFSDK
jgi:hypothetical protein